MNSIDLEIHSAVAGSDSSKYIAKRAYDSIINDGSRNIHIFDFMGIGRDAWKNIFMDTLLKGDDNTNRDGLIYYDLNLTWYNVDTNRLDDEIQKLLVKLDIACSSMPANSINPDIIILFGVPSGSMDIIFTVVKMIETFAENNVRQILITNQLPARLK